MIYTILIDYPVAKGVTLKAGSEVRIDRMNHSKTSFLMATKNHQYLFWLSLDEFEKWTESSYKSENNQKSELVYCSGY